jgi:leader peptidase (prepilin peptidase) / N-methyltransferase
VSACCAWTRQRPILGVVAVALAAAVLARYGAGAPGLIAAGASVVLVVLSAIDIEERRLPNVIVLPAATVILVARLATASGHWRLWLTATLLPALVLLLFALFYPAGLGMGDVKLALLLGATLGSGVLIGLLAGTVGAALVGLYLLSRHGAAARRRALPFAPFLAFGALVVLLAAAPGQ